MSFREEGFSEHGDYIGHQDWEINQRIELGDKVGKLVGYSTEGTNVTVEWADGSKKHYFASDGPNSDFSKLIFIW